MVSKQILEEVLGKALSTGADFAEVFVENTKNKTINMVDRQVNSITDRVIAGVGIRVFKGHRSVYGSCSGMKVSNMMKCAEKVAQALSELGEEQRVVLRERTFGDIHPIKLVPSSIANQEKIDFLKEAYTTALNYHEDIKQVQGFFLDVDHNILIANSEGLLASDRQIRTRMGITAIANKHGENQTGSARHGARLGLELFDKYEPSRYGKEAAEEAITMINAGYIEGGVMPVAIENGFGGVIFHEACGHSLEANSIAKGQSQFCDKMGQKIANEKLTAVDDGTIPNGWGSINFDDEGTKAQKNVLIENGILKSYMVDRLNGMRLGIPTTGNCRRQSYEYEPTSRMTNTFILNGTDKNSDIIKSIEHGLYAKKMGGGSVNPITGSFNFSVEEGYVIRNGKVCEPVRGASLIGKGSDIMMDIDMIGNNLDRGQGMCGSSSGSIPTDVGQPLVRVSKITVGGR